MSTIRFGLTTLLTLVLLTACGVSPTSGEGTVTRIDIGPASIFALMPGGSVHLEPTFAGSGNIPSDIAWSSSDPAVATVSADGLVEAVAPGETLISARSLADAAVASDVRVTVTAALPKSDELGLDDAGKAVAVIDGVTVPAATLVRAGGVLEVAASTLSLRLQTRDPSGSTLPILGSATYVTGTTSGSIEVQGSDFAPGSLVGIFLGEDGRELGTMVVRDDRTYYGMLPLPDEVEAGDYTLFVAGQRSTSDAAMRASQTEGPTVVAVRMRVQEDSTAAIHALSIEPSLVSLAPEQSVQLTVSSIVTGGASRDVTWQSSDPGVASIDALGIVTAVANGSATITATSTFDASVTATADIVVATSTVEQPDASMTVTPSRIEVGESATIRVVLTDGAGEPYDADPEDLTFASTLVGTIGSITQTTVGSYVATFTAGSEPGSATIVGYLDSRPLGSTASIAVTQPSYLLANTSFTISPSEIEVGQTATLRVELTDAEGNPVDADASIVTFSDTPLGTIGSVSEAGTGVFEATFTTATTTGSATITAFLDGTPVPSVATIVLVPAPLFKLAENGVTVQCPLAEVGDSEELNGVTYTKRDRAQIVTLFENGAGATGWDLLPTTCTSGITDFSKLFYSLDNNVRDTFNADISAWDVGDAVNMSEMFNSARAFNQDLSAWDVSNVTNMDRLFENARDFENGCVGGAQTCPLTWDTSSVESMNKTFYNIQFNQSLVSWDVGNVTSMKQTFYNNAAFNQDIGGWNVSSVQDFTQVFQSARTFNQDLSDWDLSSATILLGMFNNAEAFNNGCVDASCNQPLDWTLGNPVTMKQMFYGAKAFDQNISSWAVAVGTVTSMEEMFRNARAYDQPMPNWDVSQVTSMNYMFNEANAFNQDLSAWCTSATKSYYDQGADSWQQANKPACDGG